MENKTHRADSHSFETTSVLALFPGKQISIMHFRGLNLQTPGSNRKTLTIQGRTQKPNK